MREQELLGRSGQFQKNGGARAQGGGSKGFGSGGVGGSGTGPRDGGILQKKRKMAFFEGCCPVEWGGVPTGVQGEGVREANLGGGGGSLHLNFAVSNAYKKKQNCVC